MKYSISRDLIPFYVKSGLSIVPINLNTKKPFAKHLPQRVNDDGEPMFYSDNEDEYFSVVDNGKPAGWWTPFKFELPAQEWIDYWAGFDFISIAAICGGVSGGLEMLDFDVDGYYDKWRALVPGETFSKLTIQQSGSGKGMHIIYRCDEWDGNKKLAWHPNNKFATGREIAIETRGEAGYFILAPSRHESGNYYRLIQGKLSNVQRVTIEERKTMHEAAASLCQAPLTARQIQNQKQKKDSLFSPTPQYSGGNEFADMVEWYNSNTPIQDVLQKYGYTRINPIKWSRPGKKQSEGVYVIPNANKTFNHSSNDALVFDRDGGSRPASPFDYKTNYDFGGDYKEAGRWLRAKYMAENAKISTDSHRRFFSPNHSCYEGSAEEARFTFPVELLDLVDYVIIALTERDFNVLSELDESACYHPSNSDAWQNGKRTKISCIPHVLLFAGEKTAEESRKVAKSVRRAKIVRLPEGCGDLHEYCTKWSAEPEKDVAKLIEREIGGSFNESSITFG